MSTWISAAILACLTGVLTFAAFPTAWFPDVSLFPLIWFSHLPLLWLLRDKSPRASFFWGWFSGTIINVGGYYWIAHMLDTFGGFPTPLAAFGSLVHGAYLGLMWGLWALIVNRVTNTTSVGVEWAAPLAMVAVELLFPRIFPALMGNSQFPFIYVMQICDIFGVAAVTFLIYRVNAVLYLYLRARVEGRNIPWKAIQVTVAMLVIVLGYGAYRVAQIDEEISESPDLHVGIAEGDVGIFQVETKDRIRDHLRIQQRLSKKLADRGVELIVWSESSVRAGGLRREKTHFPPIMNSLDLPFHKERALDGKIRRTPQRGFKVPLLFGTTSVGRRDAPRWEGDRLTQAFNSAYLLDEDGRLLGRYDKIVLLAFGEYVPFVEYFPQFYEWVPAAGALEPGTEVKPMTLTRSTGNVEIGALICYEGILPGFVRNVMTNNPSLLVNITNDDWFGRTAERYLHLALVIPRSIEQRRSMVRSTLTGVSAFVDPVGRLIMPTKMVDPEIVDWKAPLLSKTTIYQLGGHHFSTVCSLWLFGLLIIGIWRRRSILR